MVYTICITVDYILERRPSSSSSPTEICHATTESTVLHQQVDRPPPPAPPKSVMPRQNLLSYINRSTVLLLQPHRNLSCHDRIYCLTSTGRPSSSSSPTEICHATTESTVLHQQVDRPPHPAPPKSVMPRQNLLSYINRSTVLLLQPHRNLSCHDRIYCLTSTGRPSSSSSPTEIFHATTESTVLHQQVDGLGNGRAYHSLVLDFDPPVTEDQRPSKNLWNNKTNNVHNLTHRYANITPAVLFQSTQQSIERLTLSVGTCSDALHVHLPACSRGIMVVGRRWGGQ